MLRQRALRRSHSSSFICQEWVLSYVQSPIMVGCTHAIQIEGPQDFGLSLDVDAGLRALDKEGASALDYATLCSILGAGT